MELENEPEEKESVIGKLLQYGDNISSTSETLCNLNKKLTFLETNGTQEDPNNRIGLIKQIKTLTNDVPYKYLMTETPKQLDIRLSFLTRKSKRRDLIETLVNYGYSKNYIRKLSMEELEHIYNDPTPYTKGQRQKMLNVLVDKYSWSKATVNGWNTVQMKEAFKKNLQRKYSPLAESVPKRLEPEKLKDFNYIRRGITREQYLSELSDVLFFDITS